MTIMATPDGVWTVTTVMLGDRAEFCVKQRGYAVGGDLGPQSKDLGRFLTVQSVINHMGADAFASLDVKRTGKRS